jgi:hypothetical protein
MRPSLVTVAFSTAAPYLNAWLCAELAVTLATKWIKYCLDQQILLAPHLSYFDLVLFETRSHCFLNEAEMPSLREEWYADINADALQGLRQYTVFCFTDCQIRVRECA